MKITDGQWELHDYDFATGRSVWRFFDGQEMHFRIDTPVDNIVRKTNSPATPLRAMPSVIG